jgi:DNA-binding transcriptional ArsR family regulator
MKTDGTPEAVPFYPHEFANRQSSFRVIDLSASPVMEANPDNFNPVERNRLRESIRKFGGDLSLLDLADDEFDGALGLTINIDNLVKPTIAGLLLIGRENDIRRFIPSYEVAFQVLKGIEVRINEFFRKPVISTFEEIESLIILSRLSKEKRLTFHQLMEDFQNDEARTRAAVEKLVEADLATPHGSGRGRYYTLSAKVYNKRGKKAAYIRQSGFDSIQQEEMVINYIKVHGSISRAETMELCINTKFQAYTLLKKLKDQQRILSFNSGKYTRYQLK